MKVDQKDVSAGTMLRNLEEIDDSLESTLPGQRARDIREGDRKYGSDNHVAALDAIATPYLDVAALPDSNRASNLAATNPTPKLLREDQDSLTRARRL
jgi:predicted RecA/RadA family phage recombinase